MKKLSATVTGFITGIIMILLSIGIFYYKGNFENSFQYIVYAVYIAGIVWTLANYQASDAETKNFKALFSQGFRCFIVVTLLMVAFTWIFLKINPSLEAEMAQNYREDLIKKNNYTAPEIDSMVAKAKEYFVIMLTSMAIFGYLVIGALITVIASLFFSRQAKSAIQG